MSNLLDELVQVSETLTRRETITLPMSGKTIIIKSLMTEELNRLSTTPPEKQLFTQMALAWVDEKGDLVMNPNDAAHLQKFGKFHGKDTSFAAMAINRISGVGEEAEAQGKEISSDPAAKSFSMSLPVISDEPLPA